MCEIARLVRNTKRQSALDMQFNCKFILIDVRHHIEQIIVCSNGILFSATLTSQMPKYECEYEYNSNFSWTMITIGSELGAGKQIKIKIGKCNH